jgi:hypothetical protein
MMKYAKGRWQKWARVASPQAGATMGGPAPPVGEPTLWLLSSPPSGFFSLLAKYNFLVFFLEFPDLSKHGPLTVLFPAES